MSKTKPTMFIRYDEDNGERGSPPRPADVPRQKALDQRDIAASSLTIFECGAPDAADGDVGRARWCRNRRQFWFHSQTIVSCRTGRRHRNGPVPIAARRC